jgi:tRNA threonylcarbamoyladenosine biosynthesis protein TsaE
LLEDYLTPDAVAFVEWPEIATPTLERIAFRVRLEHGGQDLRTISVEELG